jgi:hypothetical protein
VKLSTKLISVDSVMTKRRMMTGGLVLPVALLKRLSDVVLQPSRKKSKAEVMAEVMAKSKEYKVCIVQPLLYHARNNSFSAPPSNGTRTRR